MRKFFLVFSIIALSVLLTNNSVFASPQITEQKCDPCNPCGERLECYSFPGVGQRCAESNPCNYYQCPLNTECGMVQPMMAAFCPDGTTKGATPVINCQGINPDISRSGEPGGEPGVVPGVSNLIIENSQLFMETPAGKKSINIKPQEAITLSATPNPESIQDLKLKEESQRPVYSVKGKKQVKLLFIIPVSMEIETKVDAQTGDVISIKKPWWSFLAWW